MHFAQQIEEDDPLGLVRYGRCEALSNNHVPSRAFIHQQFILVESLLNGLGGVLVELVVDVAFVCDCKVVRVRRMTYF